MSLFSLIASVILLLLLLLLLVQSVNCSLNLTKKPVVTIIKCVHLAATFVGKRSWHNMGPHAYNVFPTKVLFVSQNLGFFRDSKSVRSGSSAKLIVMGRSTAIISWMITYFSERSLHKLVYFIDLHTIDLARTGRF